MKLLRIIVLILFVLVSVLSAGIYISEKVNDDKTIPVITVESDMLEVSLNATDEELLKGVTAYDGKDKDLTDKIIVESVSRFTEKGVSRVTYAVCDSDNNIAKATRKIRFKDYESPKFFVDGNLCFSMYEFIDLKGMIGANDCLEGGLSHRVVITSEHYSTSVAGAYVLDVSVSNQKGDSSKIQLPLIIEDRPLSAPSIELTEYLIYIDKGETPDFESYLVDAIDYYGNSLRRSVTIESNVNFDKEGTYHVHYYATDNQGQRGHSVMTVIVGG